MSAPEPDLMSLFNGLRRPQQTTFSIRLVTSNPNAYIAVDAHGRPALLVETNSASARRIRRKGLRLEHRANCHVSADGVDREVVASIVVCETDDSSLQLAFLRVAEIVINGLSNATEVEVAELLERLVELLEKAGEPSRTEAIGLFAELLVLQLANDPSVAVRCWRLASTERYDIDVGTSKIEVKASGTRRRLHHFSLEQCTPEDGVSVFVASTIVLEAAGGTSVRDLADRLKSLVMSDAELVLKIEAALLEVMGLPRPGEPIFDEGLALDRLRWFNIETIPAIRTAPSRVDQVKYRVDLEDEPSITLEEIQLTDVNLRPCLPRN